MRWMWLTALLLLSAGSAQADPCEVDADSTLSVLSNNVGIFPAHVVARYPEKIRAKKKYIVQDEEERTRILAKALLEFEGDPDVVLLQEIWSLKARDVLLADLGQKYPYVEHPEAPEEGLFSGMPSGLMIFSKYPLSDFAYHEFEAGIGLNKLARKGVIGARVAKDGKTVAVFNTHLQAGAKKKDPTIRPKQLSECNEFIRQFTAHHDDAATVFCGDFNIASTEPDAYGEIFARLDGARDSYRKGCGEIQGSTRNPKFPDKRIDYLLTFGDVEAVSIIVDPTGRTISDHLTVFGTVALD